MSRPCRNVRIVRLTESTAGDVARLWRRCLPQEDRCRWKASGRPTTGETLRMRVLSNKAFDPAGSFVALVRGRVAGFCLVATAAGRRPRDGFLCALAVDARLRRQGVGSRLLELAEAYLRRRGARRILTTFEGNPLALLPGAPTEAEGCSFLLNRGFRGYDRNLMLVMRQETPRFRMSAGMRRRIRGLAATGIRIGRAEPRHRTAIDRFMAKAFPGWRPGILSAFDQNPPRPLIIATRGQSVLGFSGPFDVQDSGKGHFHALGVSPATRGRGLGAALFHTMCNELKVRGAKFVVLTTGLANPAQEIYLRAGFLTSYVVDFGMNKDLRAAPGRMQGKRKA